ncbi:uncharacterized protein TNCV_4038591 [Trichonephila clavipes]|nr:uncharacterized protein TNCV_4038591 [Trichonephila clavipes]
MSTLTNSSSEDLSSVDKNPFRGRFARAFFSSCMGLPRNNAAYAANSDFEWDSVSVALGFKPAAGQRRPRGNDHDQFVVTVTNSWPPGLDLMFKTNLVKSNTFFPNTL